MVGVVFFFVILIFSITLFATNQTATKPNKNILLGVTLPYHILKDESVLKIVKEYKKSYSILFPIFLLCSAPILIVSSYPSFIIIYTFIWIITLLYFNNRVYLKYFRSLYSLKRKNDWFLKNKHMVTIDTEVTRIKNKMPISRLWFIPSLVISIIPIIITLTRESNTLKILASLPSIAMILLFLYLHKLYSSDRTVVYSEKAEINLACNYVHKRTWSICWVIIATATSISNVLMYLNTPSTVPVFLFLGILIFIGCIVYTHGTIRNIQNKLLEASEEVVYSDDDEYWERGYYYNPNDSRTMVEKRIGYGFTCNMATFRGKLFTYGIIGPVIVLILFLSITFVRMDTASFSLNINGGTAKIDAPLYAYSFNLNDIEEVKIIDDLPNGARTNGAETSKYSLGNFSLMNYGRSKMYVYKENPPYIVVKLDDIYVFLNGKTRDVTEEYYNTLLESMK